MLEQFADKDIRVFVVWEPVLPTDWGPPSTSALKRINDRRAAQFWDKGRLISRSLGEHDRKSIVWDYIAVYMPGTAWDRQAPPAVFADHPVVRVIDKARGVIRQALSMSTEHP